MLTLEIDPEALEFPLVLRPNVRMTDDELLCFSASNSSWRMERNSEGEIILMTPVTGVGGSNEMYVGRIFGNWAEQDGTGMTFSPNVGFNLPDGSTLSPDASWIPLARWNALTPDQRNSFLPLCPSFLIEVRSKTDRRKALERKMELWIANGAQLAWLIDPIAATVTIYRPGHETQTLERPDVIHGDAPVAGFVMPCTQLWPEH